jgi:hypothetical protein
MNLVRGKQFITFDEHKMLFERGRSNKPGEIVHVKTMTWTAEVNLKQSKFHATG